MDAERRRLARGILFTDLYQLTMAQVYWRAGIHERRAQFDHVFRTYPHYGEHQAGYCINAGLEGLLDWMREARFGPIEIEALRGVRGATGAPRFDAGFLDWLARSGSFDALRLLAIPEGRVVHPAVPLTVVEGPLAMAQVLESPLLNHLNYPILVATKAARIRQSGLGRAVLEFGMRRGPESGANAGGRAALIGGAEHTSNTGLAIALGLDPQGTHAHSLVQAFLALGGSELDAFRAFAESYPDDCLLLVDTVDTLGSGVPNAIRVFEELRAKGHEPLGIRLDSGDLAYLAIQAVRQLDDAGFTRTRIVLSNQIDELVLLQIVTQIREEAGRYGIDPDHLLARLVYGVGTRLITSRGDGALDGVYKLVALERDGAWQPALKLSDSPAKIPNPGQKRVFRLYDRRDKAVADLLALEDERPEAEPTLELYHPSDPGVSQRLERSSLSAFEPLLVEVWREGRLVYDLPSLERMRAWRDRDLERLDPGVRRIMNPHRYHVSLTRRLHDQKRSLVETARRRARGSAGPAV